jgi:hypothetical protein
VVSLYREELLYGKVDAVIFVNKSVMGRTQQQSIRVSISLGNRHAGIAARTVVLLGYDMGFFTNNNRPGRRCLATCLCRHHREPLCAARERTLIS